jgi:hypothetical protein
MRPLVRAEAHYGIRGAWLGLHVGGFDPDLLDHVSRQRYWMIQSLNL